MPEVNQVRNLLLANAPPNVQAQAQAGEDAVQRAAAPTGPYTSRMAGLAKALQGGLGGLMEGSAIKQAMQGRQDASKAGYGWLNSLQPGANGPSSPLAAAIAAHSEPMPSAMPMGQGGAGSDAVASGSARNPAGYDPAAARAYILARAPAYGIAPEAAHAIARSEGLNVYVGDHGSSFGPFQLHYGGVAGGGNSVGGLGDAFTKATGLDARDPSTVRQQIDFALANAAQNGWGPWHGRQTAGMGVWDGITRGGADPGIVQAAMRGTTAAPGIAQQPKPGASDRDPGIVADMPARGAQPVASNTLPPGITPDMVSAAPQSDGTLRGDITAAAAQHGGLDPDAPAPGASPTGMQGLPPGVTPAMFAASQNTATDGNALHRGDEMPAGGASPVTVSGVPHQLAPGAVARADSGAGVGVSSEPTSTPSATPASPAGQDFDPEGTGPANYGPNAGPSLRDQITAAMNKGPDLGVTQPAVVPPPVPASTPDAPPAPSVLPPGRPPSGDVAGPAVVPPPQGDAVQAPTPDGGVRGDLMAAAAQHGMDVAGPAVVPPPQGDLTAPPPSPPADPVGGGLAAGKDVALDPVVPDPVGTMTPPAPSSPNDALAGPQSDAAMGNDGPSLRDTIQAAMGTPAAAAPAGPAGDLPNVGPTPPAGIQTIQGAADRQSAAAAAAAPPLDPEVVGLPGAEPTLRDQIASQVLGSGAGTSGPQSDAAAPLAPASAAPNRMASADVGDPGLDAMRAGMVGQAPGGSSSGSAPLPTMAQAGVPGLSPMPPQPGTGAALPSTGPTPPPGGQSTGSGSSLPQTGPMPPPGAQTLAAAAVNPDAPAPNAVPAGPMPLPASPPTPPPAPMPDPFAPGSNAPPGNSPTNDPAGALSFMRQEAARAHGGAPTPGGFMASLGQLFSPAAPQNGGSGLMLGAPAQPPAPSPVGTGQGGAPTPMQGSGSGGQGGGGAPASPASAPAPAGAAAAAGFGGLTPEQRQAGLALLTGPNAMYLDPAVKEAITARLFAQPKYETLQNGDLYRLDPTGATPPQFLVHGGKFGAARGVGVYNEGTGLGPNGQPVGGSTLLTPAEVQSNGFPAGTHVQRAANGELSVINPGATADAGNEFNKTLSAAYAEDPAAMIKGVATAQDNQRQFNEMSGAIQRLQQNGGTTGMGQDEIMHLQNAINSGANLLGITQPFNLSDQEVIGKINRQVASAAAKQMSTRGATNFDFAQLQQANPGLEMSPQGNIRMLGIMSQMEQRKIDLGTAYRNAYGTALANRTPIDPTVFDRIRTSYDADQSHHIVDPVTGQDITANPRLPDVAPTPGQNGQPLPGGMPNPRGAGGQVGAPSMAQQPAPAAQPQGGQGQGGGYLPGAARNVGPGVTGGPPAQQGQGAQPQAGQGGDPLSQARAAIARGAPRAAVMQRLQGMGINTAGL